MQSVCDLHQLYTGTATIMVNRVATTRPSSLPPQHSRAVQDEGTQCGEVADDCTLTMTDDTSGVQVARQHIKPPRGSLDMLQNSNHTPRRNPEPHFRPL